MTSVDAAPAVSAPVITLVAAVAGSITLRSSVPSTNGGASAESWLPSRESTCAGCTPAATPVLVAKPKPEIVMGVSPAALTRAGCTESAYSTRR